MIHKAIEFAAKKHDGQKRKGGDVPFIVHPTEVMYYLAVSGADKETVVAGILHDTVEDTPTSLDEIAAIFGEKVAMLVGIETEDKTKSWAVRKAENIKRIAVAPKDAMLICCADKLCNLKSIYHDLLAGLDVWSRFTGTREQTKQVYHDTIKALSPLEGMFIYQRLTHYYDLVFPTTQTN